MSNKERCIQLLDSFTEVQLANVAVMLESLKCIMDDAFHAETMGAERIKPE